LKQSKCYLLIGNSRWHWAIKAKGIWNYFHTPPNNTNVTTIHENLWTWASVGDIPQNIRLNPFKEIQIKNIPLANLPSWLGIDRALGSWEAYEQAKIQGLHSKGILMADAGTILSITKITAEGKFDGGQLIPGLDLQRKSIATKAFKINDPKNYYIPKKIFPTSTEEAILRGSFQSLIGVLIEAQKESNLPIWLCGGDSEILFNSLKNHVKIIHSPNLVLEAMTKINI